MWCAGNPGVSVPPSATGVRQICNRALSNFHIEDEVIEKPRRACVAKLASHYVISVARGPERNRCRDCSSCGSIEQKQQMKDYRHAHHKEPASPNTAIKEQ